MAVSEVEVLFGDRLSYRETMAGGPPWLCWELIATEPARQKLERWVEGAGPPPWRQWEPDLLELDRFFIGDVTLLLAAAAVLTKLPPPVQQYVAHRVTFVGMGVTVEGLCAPAPDTRRPWLIVLTAGDGTPAGVKELIAHEIGHSWLAPEPTPGRAPVGALEHDAIMTASLEHVRAKHPAAEPVIARYRRRLATEESKVEALLRVWDLRSTPKPVR